MPNLKQELETLLREFPLRLPSSSYNDAIDDCVDDIEAAVIRALNNLGDEPEPVNEELEHQTEDVFLSQFGATLFNLFTTERWDYRGYSNMTYSTRKRIVWAMIRTMLQEMQSNQVTRDDEQLFAALTVAN